MKTRLLPAVMSILIMTSLFCPVVAADRWEEPELGAAPVVVFAIPEVTKLAIDGATIILGSAIVMKIGQELGIRWDDFVKTMGIVGKTEKGNTEIEDTKGNTVTVQEPLWKVKENWAKFVSDVTKGLNDLFHAKEWISATSDKGEAVMKAQYECYCADVPPGGGKKDDKWYFEARRNHGKIEINTERMNEEQAVKEMGRGKDIMTLNRQLATDVVNRFKDGGIGRRADTLFEEPHHNTEGYYYHLHFGRNAIERLHCWIWKNV